MAYGDWRRLQECLSTGRNSTVEVAGVVVPPQETDDAFLGELLSSDNLRRERIEGIIVVSGERGRIPAQLLLRCRLDGFRVLDESSFLEQEACRIDVDAENLAWLLGTGGFRIGQFANVKDRVFDVAIALLILLVTLPLMLFIAILIKIDSLGPVLYRQERVGLRGRNFTLYKFRSMYRDAEASGQPTWAAVGDCRITRVGKFIRCTRLDELPQLLNVLRGEMSIIGPRPERPYFVQQLADTIPLYTARHYIKPGITGWAQVNAPYGASVEDARQKLCYDLFYVKHRGFLLKLEILARTFGVVVRGQGAR